MEMTLTAHPRAGTGKGPARQARMAGRVPAVLYGSGVDPLALDVDAKQMGLVLHAGSNVLVTLEVEGGKRYLTMVREVQRHPVRGTLIHIDFVNTARDVRTHASVPVAIVGESQGLRLGGLLEHHLWELQIEALPTDIPQALEVDITALNIGDHLRVADVVAPGKLTIVNDPEEIVVSIVEPKAAKAAAADEATAEGETGA